MILQPGHFWRFYLTVETGTLIKNNKSTATKQFAFANNFTKVKQKKTAMLTYIMAILHKKKSPAGMQSAPGNHSIIVIESSDIRHPSSTESMPTNNEIRRTNVQTKNPTSTPSEVLTTQVPPFPEVVQPTSSFNEALGDFAHFQWISMRHSSDSELIPSTCPALIMSNRQTQ